MREYPKLDLTGTSVAVAYHFRVDKPLGGWAICTVNDRTGELTVQSDWGNWSHRWNTDHIGRPSLTHFIADRDAGADDYLAAKLLGRDDCWEWDRAETVKAFRKHLAERRLEVGHREDRAHAYMRDGIFHRLLTSDLARELWDALGELEHAHDEREFIEMFTENDDLIRWVDDTPYESTKQKPSHEYLILTRTILPALIEACRAQLRTASPEADHA